MLTNQQLTDNLLQLAGVTSNTNREDIVEAVRIAKLTGQQEFALWGAWAFLEEYQSEVYIPLQAPYTTGTVVPTRDSKTITGVGTTWTKDMEGSFININNQTSYEIATFVSTTNLTLTIPFQGLTVASPGVAYTILKRFYPLPLDFLRPDAEQAVIQIPDTTSESIIAYRKDASFTARVQAGGVSFFSIQGNTRQGPYYSTGTVTVSGNTWTVSSGTLPLDSVDREVRIAGEDTPYRISGRTNATVFTTYQTYANPANGTSVNAVAAAWSMTPTETLLIGFQEVPIQRYIFKMPYVKRLSELIAPGDVSPISRAGYDSAFLAMCRYKLAQDSRAAIRDDIESDLTRNKEAAMAVAWGTEQMKQGDLEQAEANFYDGRQTGPSWFR